MSYYRILVSPNATNQWFPNDPVDEPGVEIDARLFTEGRPYLGRRPASVPLMKAGTASQFSLAAFDMPIVSRHVGELFSNNCSEEVQLFPVLIDGLDGYSILNVIHAPACFDESRSEFDRWQAKHGRPDRIGEYLMVTRLVIDPSKTHELDVFRIEGWEIALIVSEKMKALLECVAGIGVVFQSVN